MFLTIITLCSFSIGLFYRFVWLPDRYPVPGPPGIPLFGNIFQMPVIRPWEKFLEWAHRYGPLMRLKVGPEEMVVISDAEIVDELFVGKSAAFSSRNPPFVASEILGKGQRIAFMEYGPKYKHIRNALHSALGRVPARKHRQVQELESRVLVHDLMNYGLEVSNAERGHGTAGDDHWFSMVRRFTTSVVMTTTYGRRVEKIHDNPLLTKVYDVVQNFARMSLAGQYIADTFPILRKFPDYFSPWRVEGRKKHLWELDLYGGLVTDILKDAEHGIKRPDCFTSDYIQARSEHSQGDYSGIGFENGWLKDTSLAYVSGTLLEAGSDTTASIIESFMLMMLNNPDKLAKAQQEIDGVVGFDRMPTFEDEENLPYTIACIKETLRCAPSLPIGLPHRCNEDTWCRGLLVRKGATVIGSVFAMHMDPEQYPEPTKFTPERFLKPGIPTSWRSGPGGERDHYAFGWGRRFCPGSYFAEASMFISLARVLWALKLEAPYDTTTKCHVIPCPGAQSTWSDEHGFLLDAKPFGVSFTPRSMKHREIVRQAFEDAQMQWELQGLRKDIR